MNKKFALIFASIWSALFCLAQSDSLYSANYLVSTNYWNDYFYQITDLELDWEFYLFINKYGRNYSTMNEYYKRRSVFQDNFDFIRKHNSLQNSYKVGFNEYMDMFPSEYSPNIALYSASKKLAEYKHYSVEPMAADIIQYSGLPKSVDWRKKGAVSAVKNQGQCGSCWSFSATGSIEGAWKIKKGKLIDLSEQQLMDCSKPEGDDSCEGGLMDDAFEYVIKSGGICSENDYPYKAIDQNSCKICKKVAKISSYIDVQPNNKTALMEAVSKGPVSIAIEADQQSFQFYTSGVYSDPNCGTNLDHGVLVVGYSTETKPAYWIVKNSWGASWGNNGYILLKMDTDNSEGQCGILMKASYPVV